MRLKPGAVDCGTLTRLQIKSRLQTTLYNTLSSHHSLLLFIPAVTSGYWLFKGFSGSLINKKRAEEKTKWLSASTTRRPRKEERKALSLNCSPEIWNQCVRLLTCIWNECHSASSPVVSSQLQAHIIYSCSHMNTVICSALWLWDRGGVGGGSGGGVVTALTTQSLRHIREQHSNTALTQLTVSRNQSGLAVRWLRVSL